MSVQDLPADQPTAPAPATGSIRSGPLAAGLLILAAAWLGPLPTLARTTFWAHMTMHMAVVAIAAPFLALAIAGTRRDPARRWPSWLAPIPASLIELAVVWAWHAPALHQSARHEPIALILEQASFLTAGLLLWLAALGGEGEPRSPHERSGSAPGGRVPSFSGREGEHPSDHRRWWSGPGLLAGGRRGPREPQPLRIPKGPSADRVEARAHGPEVLHARAGPPARSPGPLPPPPSSNPSNRAAAGVIGLLLTSMHMTLLGALLALAPRPLYAHAGTTTLTPLADQHLGGAIMLLVGGAAYLAGGLWLTAGLLRSRLPLHSKDSP